MGKARAKKLNEGVSLQESGMDVGGRRASALPAGKATNAQQADRDAKIEMAKLTAQIKTTGSAPDGVTKRALDNIRARFGDEAGQEALRKFNAAFRGYRPSDQVPKEQGTMNSKQQARAVLMTVGNQADRGKTQIKQLKQQLRGDETNPRVAQLLKKLDARFGRPAYLAGVKQLNLTFGGLNGPPSGLLE